MDAEVPDLAVAFTGYLAERRLSANTRESYRRDVESFLAYLAGTGGQSPLTVDSATIARYLESLKEQGRSPSTVARRLASLRAFYRFLDRQRLVEADPTERTPAPRAERQTPA
ncbi:MAG TPA: site-specific integrase, partial [Firmicutes bacterium]|nr:site-specific integrase [Bacillota bacterium]